MINTAKAPSTYFSAFESKLDRVMILYLDPVVDTVEPNVELPISTVLEDGLKWSLLEAARQTVGHTRRKRSVS